MNELERERERERGDSCLGTIDAPFKEDPVGTIVNIYSSLSILFIQKALQASSFSLKMMDNLLPAFVCFSQSEMFSIYCVGSGLVHVTLAQFN